VHSRYELLAAVRAALCMSLEQQWEAALRAQRDLKEEYDRFLNGE
jgi:hypothetical protein